MGWCLTEWGLYLPFCLGSLKRSLSDIDFCFRFDFLINEYFKTRRIFRVVSVKLVLLFVH